MRILTKVDNHGVVEFRSIVAIPALLLLVVASVAALGYCMYLAENGVGNVKSFQEGVWVITMTMTTIGYGDFYPVTQAGRLISWSSFIIGAVELGTLIALVSSALGSDKSIQNRELRTMLCEVMRKLELVEQELKLSTLVTKDSHLLDVVFKQSPYSSDTLEDGFLTAGKDSTGIYMLSVCAYDAETGQEVHRWIPETSRRSLMAMYNRYLNNSKEL